MAAPETPADPAHALVEHLRGRLRKAAEAARTDPEASLDRQLGEVLTTVRELRSISEDAGVEELLDLLRVSAETGSTHGVIVHNVIDALAGVAPEEEFASALLAVVRSPGVRVEVRNGAAGRLGELGLRLPEEGLDQLVTSLRDPACPAEEKEIAALALRRSVGEPEVRSALADVADVGEPSRLARAATEALVPTLEPEVLIGWMAADRPALRRAIVSGLDQARPEEIASMPAEARAELARLIAGSASDVYRLPDLRVVAALDPGSGTERELALQMVKDGDGAGAPHLFSGSTEADWAETVADALLSSSPRPQAMAEVLQGLNPEQRAVLVVKGRDALRSSVAEVDYRRTLEAAAADGDAGAIDRLWEIGVNKGDEVRRTALQAANILAVVAGKDAQSQILAAATSCRDYEVSAGLLHSLQSVATADVLADLRGIADLHGQANPEDIVPPTPEERFGTAATDLFRDITERRALEGVGSLEDDGLRAVVRGVRLEGADDPERARVERAARELVRRGADPDDVAEIVFRPLKGVRMPGAGLAELVTERRIEVAAAIGARRTLDAIATDPHVFRGNAVQAVALATREKCEAAVAELRPDGRDLDGTASGRRALTVDPVSDELDGKVTGFDVEAASVELRDGIDRLDDGGDGRGLEFP